MSWICPWCGVENDSGEPEGRHNQTCRSCHETVPPREKFEDFKRGKMNGISDRIDELQTEIFWLEIDAKNINQAEYDREKVRMPLAQDQQTLPFEVPA